MKYNSRFFYCHVTILLVILANIVQAFDDLYSFEAITFCTADAFNIADLVDKISRSFRSDDHT